jgi:hypothetical protein
MRLRPGGTILFFANGALFVSWDSRIPAYLTEWARPRRARPNPAGASDASQRSRLAG